MKKSLSALAIGLLFSASPAFALLSNGGFEQGDTSGWTVVGDNSVITSFTPQFTNTTGWLSGVPYYGKYSLLLGSGDVGNVTDNAHHSTATQTGTVTQADINSGLHLFFKWGAILEEPTNGVFHADADQPYFSISIAKVGGGTIYFADHRANQPGFTKVGTNATGDAGDIWYGSATTDIDLTTAGLGVGDQVKIDLYVQDCGLGGHGGLVILDGFGTTNPDLPEPGTLFLLGAGLVGLFARRKKA
jgi:hypothetical protein